MQLLGQRGELGVDLDAVRHAPHKVSNTIDSSEEAIVMSVIISPDFCAPKAKALRVRSTNCTSSLVYQVRHLGSVRSRNLKSKERGAQQVQGPDYLR